MHLLDHIKTDSLAGNSWMGLSLKYMIAIFINISKLAENYFVFKCRMVLKKLFTICGLFSFVTSCIKETSKTMLLIYVYFSRNIVPTSPDLLEQKKLRRGSF